MIPPPGQGRRQAVYRPTSELPELFLRAVRSALVEKVLGHRGPQGGLQASRKDLKEWAGACYFVGIIFPDPRSCPVRGTTTTRIIPLLQRSKSRPERLRHIPEATQ